MRVDVSIFQHIGSFFLNFCAIKGIMRCMKHKNYFILFFAIPILLSDIIAREVLYKNSPPLQKHFHSLTSLIVNLHMSFVSLFI